MRVKLASLALCCFVWGCVYLGRDFPTAPAKSIENNVTTQNNIFNYFGEPMRRGLENGYETWDLLIHHLRTRPAA